MDSEDQQEFERFVKEKEIEIIEKFKFLFSQNLFNPHNNIFKLKTWLNNFIDPEERLLALFILENLIYRDPKMLESAVTRLLVKEIKNIYENINNCTYDVFQWLQLLRSNSSNLKIKFVGVDKGEISQSSAVITRKLSPFIDRKYIPQNPEAINTALQNNDLIVYVDDFLGSGKQFSEFIDEKIITLDNYSSSNSPMLYIPLIAIHKGIDKIKRDYSHIKIFPSEIIKIDHQLFNKDDIESFYKDFKRTPEQLDSIFNQIRKRFRINPQSWYGRSNAMQTVVFEWGCPNQTISMLYHDRDVSAYYPLVPRRS